MYLCLLAGATGAFAANEHKLPLHLIELPPGFEIDVFAYPVPNARGMTQSEKGTIYVGTRRKGVVYAITDEDGDFKADRIRVIAKGLNMPVGVEYLEGDLYISSLDRVVKIPQVESHLDQISKPVMVNDTLPDIGHHGWKYIRFGPDGKLYVPVGAPCNICFKDDPRFASIMRMDRDGRNLEVFASGVRNTVGFDWDPRTGELWFTDNGRDWLGDNFPPDELNHAPSAGMHFGFPFCHGKNIPDPEFGQKRSCSEITPPAVELDAHVASLGMKFYEGNMFPPEYLHNVFIAEHGSWNRSKKSGYRITRVHVEGGKELDFEVFAQGWLHGQKVWGRPVDILELSDGSLLVSDDHAGAIYRISYRK